MNRSLPGYATMSIESMERAWLPSRMSQQVPGRPKGQVNGLAALAAGLLLLLPVIAQSDSQVAETIVTEQMCSGLFFMPLEWTSKEGQTHQLQALFDTGASIALIDPDTIERISGKRLETGTRAIMENVNVAGLGFSTFSPRVRELDHLGQALGRSFDVFLPFQAFDNFLLTLDYGKQQVRVSQGSLPRPDGEEIFSAKGPDSRPWIRIRVGSRNRPLLLDSGSNGTISVRPHRSIRWAGATAEIRLSQGMNKLVLNEVGRYAGVMRIGPLDFAEPIVGLTDDTELLGYDVLKHFVLTFDQKKKRVRMQPISSSPVRMQARSGTGALLQPRADSLEVARIVPGSPAEDAGLQAGDQVTHIDGVPVNERGCRDMRQPTGTVEYTILRDSTARTFRMENAILIP